MLRLLWKLLRLLFFGIWQSPTLCARQDCACDSRGFITEQAKAANYCALKLCDKHCEDYCDCLKRAATEAKRLDSL